MKNLNVPLATSYFPTFDWTICFVVVRAENARKVQQGGARVYTELRGVWFDE